MLGGDVVLVNSLCECPPSNLYAVVSYSGYSSIGLSDRYWPKGDIHVQKNRAPMSAAFSMEPDGSLPCYR